MEIKINQNQSKSINITQLTNFSITININQLINKNDMRISFILKVLFAEFVKINEFLGLKE